MAKWCKTAISPLLNALEIPQCCADPSKFKNNGNKPLSEPMMVSLLTHICITLPQWVKLQQFMMKSIACRQPCLYSKDSEGVFDSHLITRLIWTIWTPMSSVPQKANKLNLSPPFENWCYWQKINVCEISIWDFEWVFSMLWAPVLCL